MKKENSNTLNHQGLKDSVRKFYRYGNIEPAAEAKFFLDKPKIDRIYHPRHKWTKEMIEKEAQLYLSGSKVFPSKKIAFSNAKYSEKNPSSLDTYSTQRRLDSFHRYEYSRLSHNPQDSARLCSWGEWGAFDPCDEILPQLCKRLRVREPKNMKNCWRYIIDVEECYCTDDTIFNRKIVQKVEKENTYGTKYNPGSINTPHLLHTDKGDGYLMDINENLGYFGARGNAVHNKKPKNKKNRKSKDKGNKRESKKMQEELDLLKMLDTNQKDVDDEDANTGTNSNTANANGLQNDVEENVDSNAADVNDEDTDTDNTNKENVDSDKEVANGENPDNDDTDYVDMDAGKPDAKGIKV